jgi:hypothetical protein
MGFGPFFVDKDWSAGIMSSAECSFKIGLFSPCPTNLLRHDPAGREEASGVNLVIRFAKINRIARRKRNAKA